MIGYGHTQYTKTQVETVDPGKLIVLLYEGAISFLQKSKECIEKGDFAGLSLNVNRAMDIIDELDCSLNTSEGGEVAQNLRRLYRFVSQHLIKYRVDNNPAIVNDVIKILGQLNDAWKEALSQPEAQEMLAKKQTKKAQKVATTWSVA